MIEKKFVRSQQEKWFLRNSALEIESIGMQLQKNEKYKEGFQLLEIAKVLMEISETDY